eukprot:276982-Amphidinium_carterae.1
MTSMGHVEKCDIATLHIVTSVCEVLKKRRSKRASCHLQLYLSCGLAAGQPIRRQSSTKQSKRSKESPPPHLAHVTP